MRRIAMAVAAVIGLSTLVPSPTTPAVIEGADCTLYVMDDTANNLVIGQGRPYEGASKMLSLGAEVRVRAAENFPHGADGYIADMVAKCPSWLDAKMVIIAYAPATDGDYTNPAIKIVVGSYWAQKRGMDGETLDKIVTNLMRPTLAKYNKDDPATWPDVADGIAAGEDAVAAHMKPANLWPWIIGGLIVFWGSAIGGVVYVRRSRRGGDGDHPHDNDRPGGFDCTSFVQWRV